MNNLTSEEMEELRKVLLDLPQERREKIISAFHSGRLVSIVVFFDSIVGFFEKLGKLGSWVNSVLKPILTGAAVLFLGYLVVTGKISLQDIKP